MKQVPAIAAVVFRHRAPSALGRGQTSRGSDVVGAVVDKRSITLTAAVVPRGDQKTRVLRTFHKEAARGSEIGAVVMRGKLEGSGQIST